LSARVATWVAWSAGWLSITLTALSLLLLVVNLSYPSIHIFDAWVEYTVSVMTFSAVGAVIASRRPENPIGWIFCAIAIIGGVRHLGAQYATYTQLVVPGSLPAGEALAWITSWLWVFYLGLYVFLGLLFPNGRLPSSHWRWVAWIGATVVLGGAISVAVSPGPIQALDPRVQNPLAITGAYSTVKPILILLYTLGLAMAISLFVRLRRARGVERQQLKWFAYTVTVALSGAIPKFVIFPMLGVSASWVSWASSILTMAGLVGIPIAIGIAILKYRLYDIDFIINRTLVYGALTTSVVGLYALMVGSVGSLVQSRSNFMISLLATGLIAVLFAPLRDRLQHGVNRLIYGYRDDPYTVLSRLGRRLESTIAPEAVLTTIVETIAQALRLPYAAILLQEAGDFRSAAVYGIPTGEPQALPLVYQREEIGQLVVSPRASGEEFSSADRSLLEDLARQAEVAVHAVRLTTDLQRSRERLVTTREEERRRLRRDLHDGLGPTLASFALKVDAARKLIRHKPGDAEKLLSRLKDQTQDTVGDVRRLVYGLRPPALDDLGLVAAIRQQAESQGFVVEGFSEGTEKEVASEDGLVSFTIEIPESLPALPAAVEVAAYRIAQEALTNLARHAYAKTCRVRISIDRGGSVLELEVRDDGVGLPERRRSGVGLSSMLERAEELGGKCDVEPDPEGGTRVLARLPLPLSEERPEEARSLWRAPSASS
jgi:signal transduction histidine kinase